MTPVEHVAIIGLGLIGGSVARDLAASGIRVSAYDPDATHVAAAIRTHVVEGALGENLDELGDADVVIIAVPVDAAIDVLRRIAPRARRAGLITDVGSTKSRIVALASELGLGERFVGAHPLAGDHRSGWEASRSGLFRGARVFLCPARDATTSTIELAERLWRDLGANPERIDAEEHDVQLAWTSHLPHLVSASLALALARVGVTRADLGPGGRDVTRLAGSSPEMWSAIAMDNAPAMEEALRETERELASFRAALAQADIEEVRARFVAARDWFRK